MSAERAAVDVRPHDEHDDAAVLGLLQASLGWVPDAAYAEFFHWKHRQSPFGRSPAWVAVVDGRVVGFRTFLPWEFVLRGATVRAVRAVDTATHPDHQGRGIFSSLTLAALDALRDDGVQFVFNTPNDNSRPGYLKMGWQVVGRLPVSMRPSSASSLVRTLRARVPADKWSVDTTAGEDATTVFAETEHVADLLRSVRTRADRITTNRSPQFLAWRYGFAPLRYRVLLAGRRIEDGVLVFRVRRRGRATEAVVCDVMVPGDDRSTTRALLGEVVRCSGADYALSLGGTPIGRQGVRVPRQGPTLTWRGLGADLRITALGGWQLNMGDVELF